MFLADLQEIIYLLKVWSITHLFNKIVFPYECGEETVVTSGAGSQALLHSTGVFLPVHYQRILCGWDKLQTTCFVCDTSQSPAVCFEHNSKIDCKSSLAQLATSSNCSSGDLSATLLAQWECLLYSRLASGETKQNSCHP